MIGIISAETVVDYPKLLKSSQGTVYLAYLNGLTGAVSGIRMKDGYHIGVLALDTLTDYNLPLTIQNKV